LQNCKPKTSFVSLMLISLVSWLCCKAIETSVGEFHRSCKVYKALFVGDKLFFSFIHLLLIVYEINISIGYLDWYTRIPACLFQLDLQINHLAHQKKRNYTSEIRQRRADWTISHICLQNEFLRWIMDNDDVLGDLGKKSRRIRTEEVFIVFT